MNAKNLDEENKLIESGFEYVRYSDKCESCYLQETQVKSSIVQGSGSIVRLSMTASRAADPGSNPGRSTKQIFTMFSGINAAQ